MQLADRVWDVEVPDLPPGFLNWIEEKQRKEREGTQVPLYDRVDLPLQPIPRHEPGRDNPTDRGVEIIQMYGNCGTVYHLD